MTRRQTIHGAMCRLADGDRTAFPLLVEVLWPVLLRFARRGLADNADAEDVAQQVFVRLCAQVGAFDPTQDGLSWALSIAGYEILTQRHRRARRREVNGQDLLPTLADAGRSPEQLAVDCELDDALRDAVESLPEEDQRALGWMTPSNAAPATMRKRRQRALGRLRNLWRSLYGEP